jgi:Domain of unknown function (DUF4956)
MENTLFTEYFLLRLLINTVSMIILIRFIYFTTHQTRDLFFTYFLLNFIVFLLTFMLEKAKAFNSMGSAFGLLAAFSLLRFRTETITTRDMTYLFIIMAIGLVNSVMKGSYLEIMATNIMVIGVVFAVDSNVLMKNQKAKVVQYESLEHIRPEHTEKLISILKERTGLDIKKISIEEIDFKKSTAMIKIYYF